MSYYIKSNSGPFISGLYASQDEASAAKDRYVRQNAKRYLTQDKQREVLHRLNGSLTIVKNNVVVAPSWITSDLLATELYLRIAGDSIGTIYTRPLLLGLIKTRVIGNISQNTYWEVTPEQKIKALANLIGGAGPLSEHGDTIIRTKNHFGHGNSGTLGIFKTSVGRV